MLHPTLGKAGRAARYCNHRKTVTLRMEKTVIIPPVLPQKDDPQIRRNVNVGRRKRGKKVSYELTVQIEPLKKKREEDRKVGFSSTTQPRHVGSRIPCRQTNNHSRLITCRSLPPPPPSLKTEHVTEYKEINTKEYLKRKKTYNNSILALTVPRSSRTRRTRAKERQVVWRQNVDPVFLVL